MSLEPPVLEIEERHDGLRIVRRFEQESSEGSVGSAVGCALALGVEIASAGAAYAYETWILFLIGVPCAAGLAKWLAPRDGAIGEGTSTKWREDVWRVNASQRRLEHNDQIVALFSEMRVVWASSGCDEDGDWSHSLHLTLHRNRSYFDKTLLWTQGPEGERALFQRAAILIAQHSGARLREH